MKMSVVLALLFLTFPLVQWEDRLRALGLGCTRYCVPLFLGYCGVRGSLAFAGMQKPWEKQQNGSYDIGASAANQDAENSHEIQERQQITARNWQVLGGVVTTPRPHHR